MWYISTLRAELREAALASSDGWKYAGELKRELDALKAKEAKS